ncbi:hypothetical protein [Paenibacillus tuaregi]|uniref:hypothetical protein n=1 Tax=Paenibacillus tuaregi TaxID=1816681 RepID=UPI000839991F|nr:hypothetical protein [Paenibacillus tuaregi]
MKKLNLGGLHVEITAPCFQSTYKWDKGMRKSKRLHDKSSAGKLDRAAMAVMFVAKPLTDPADRAALLALC